MSSALTFLIRQRRSPKKGARTVEAGATILHIHARQPNGLPAFDVETYRQIYEEVRQRTPNVIVNFSTGAVGLPREERIHHIRALRPDMAALNMGSMNYAIYLAQNATLSTTTLSFRTRLGTFSTSSR